MKYISLSITHRILPVEQSGLVMDEIWGVLNGKQR